MSEFDRTPEAFAKRLKELDALAKTLGYDGVEEQGYGIVTGTMFTLIRRGKFVTGFGSLDSLERYLRLPR